MRAARAPAALAVLAALMGGVAGEAWGAAAPGAPGGAEPPPIQDNSFLVEEAYNQESRVVQHIFNWTRFAPAGDYVFGFTQEWPLLSQRHQLSYTILHVSRSDARIKGWGDFAINYRCQLLGIGGGRVAAAPRISLLLPTGDAREELGAGSVGGQFNLPLSLELPGRIVTHTNLGFTYVGDAGDTRATVAYSFGQSLVWLAASRFNPLIELAWFRIEPAGGGSGDPEESLLVSPGFRWAHDFRSGLQIVPGIAFPVGTGPQSGNSGVLLYLSFEHGF